MEWLDMSGNGWKWLKITKNDFRSVKMTDIANIADIAVNLWNGKSRPKI